MRIPMSPPPLENLFSKRPERALELIHSPEMEQFCRRCNSNYHHWDKLRYIETPEDFTTQEAWLAVKWSRASQYIRTPLEFQDGKEFCYWVPPRHQEWMHKIDQDAGGMIGSQSKHFVRDDDDRYLLSSLMEEAIASSQLEGATTTREIAKDMLRSNRRPKNLAEKMIVNNYKAIMEIRELKDKPLSPKILCHIQEVITGGTLENAAAAGRFRIAEDPTVVVVNEITDEVLHKPPSPDELDRRIKQLCQFANNTSGSFIHPVTKAIILHFMIGFIHPFVDGNGRTARAIFYWYMLKSGYWLFEYLPISRIVLDAPIQYARAYLYTETDGGDMTYFLQYHLRVIEQAVRKMHDYFAQEQSLMHQATAALAGIDGLNYRQISLMTECMKQPTLRTTVHQHSGTFSITKATARTDLLDLESRGLLRKVAEGKRHVFVATAHIKKRLSRGSFSDNGKLEIDPRELRDGGTFVPIPRKQRSLFD